MNRIVTKGKTPREIIQRTVSVLKDGGLVVFPTDTVYGLLVDATNPNAVAKLTAFKNRPAGKAISIFVSDFKMMYEFVEVSSKDQQRLQEFLPGPFTIVLPSKHTVNINLEAENGTLGVRIPANELVVALIKAFGRPLTATSANMSGKAPCYSIEALLKQLSGKKHNEIDLFVDAGQLSRNKPSTVVDLTGESVRVLREGDYSTQFMVHSSWLSKNEDETKKIAREILMQSFKRLNQRPVVFILKGDLGAGKTIFVKGIGEALGITNIISPTFVVYYEYEIPYVILAKARITPEAMPAGRQGSPIGVGDDKVKVNKLIHYDLYRLQESEEFKHLGIEEYLQPGNVLCFEWGEKSAPIFDDLKKKAKIVVVTIDYKSESERTISVSG